MKRYIVLSVNSNPDYLYFVPLVMQCWINLGWQPLVLHNSDNYGKRTPVEELAFSIHPQNFIWEILVQSNYRSDTITQVSRLYAGGYFVHTPDVYLMTGDIDMLPLSDYWKPGMDKITCYGHDLTGYGHYPICYIGMTNRKWREVMGQGFGTLGEEIQEGMIGLPQARSKDFYKYWFTDQDLVTQKLQPYKKEIVSINRGQYSNGYAHGRVDRGAWSLNHSEFIDCHMFQQLYFKQNQDKFDKTMELLTSIWPDEDFGWWIKYTEEFRKLTGQA